MYIFVIGSEYTTSQEKYSTWLKRLNEIDIC